MTKTKRITIVALCLALLLTIGGEFVLSLFSIKAKAAATQYSGVMEDLQEDREFDETLYPHDALDYSLKVIQIGEGANGDLYVYVYQPSAPTKVLFASSIVISMGGFDDKDYDEYQLSLVSSQGVFQKYRVNGFTLKSDETRYYEITEIFRPFDKNIDKAPTDDNTINYKAFPVGHLWTVTGTGENLKYECSYVDLIDVESKHVGFIEYDGGTFWFDSDVYSHYVAFSTDHDIDKILEVDIKYLYKTFYDYGRSKNEEGPYPKEKTLYSSEIFEINTTGFFKESYQYNRIQSIDDFLENEGTSSMREKLSDMEWVLRFHESDTEWGLTYNADSFAYYGYNKWSEVSEVALFRIMYEYDGVVYNLGVVDDKQTGDSKADVKVNPESEEWWQKIMFILSFILFAYILGLLSPVINIVGNIAWRGIKFILNKLVFVSILPFRLLWRLLFGK